MTETNHTESASSGAAATANRVENTREFAGWGQADHIDDLPTGSNGARFAHGKKLGELEATAICGNDITSSCLYVSALCALQAGVYASIVLAVVAAVLLIFRKIYAEVGSALPLNGGAYNALLNTTTKAKASMAACLTLLSYIATAVISANEAMHYAHNLYHGVHVFNATIVLLGAFALLNLMGITESARVAVGIFTFHIFTLIVLVVTCIVAVSTSPQLLVENWQMPQPRGIGGALFFGFAAAMLGISGFESSANFIEEQERGVFSKTLRNMWIAVAIFNPLISFLSFGLIANADFVNHTNDLLAQMGLRSGLALGLPGFGTILEKWVSLNAVLVLSGAVLTSYVGVLGLVRRMSLDRCLPQFLLAQNKRRQTNHWIIFVFFLLCCSILAITNGDVTVLGGVYALSFLGVMALFAIGNMLLKLKRDRLPRDERASWAAVVAGLIAVILGIAGNLILSPTNAYIFVAYFLVTVTIVGLMFLRVDILRIFLYAIRSLVSSMNFFNQRISRFIIGKINEINSQAAVFFTRGDDAVNLNRAALYVIENEQTKHLKVVSVYQKDSDIPARLGADLKLIDQLYPQLRIDYVAVKGVFGPELIEELSKRLNVPKNYMFIGCPSNKFPHRIEELGGVRLIV